MQEALNATKNVLQETLGDRLLAVVIYGDLVGGYFQPGESAAELLVLVAGPIPWEQLRVAYRPVWQQHQHTLGRAPTITTVAGWQRYASLRPNFVYQLEHHGQPLFGKLPAIGPTFDQHLAYAQFCQRAISASAILAPELLHDEAKHTTRQHLRQLLRELNQATISDESDVALFSQIQEHLSSQAGKLQLVEPDIPTQSETPPKLPQLKAIFEKVDQLVLVLPDLSSRAVGAVDWPEVAELVAADYGSLHICTPLQLQSSAKLATPAAILLRHYEHAWGHNLLANITVTSDEILLEAARHAATVYLEDMPADYLQSTDDELSKLVHDYQNKLLNVQLQHELFHRLLGLEKVAPDLALPGRGTPMPDRVAATLYHLNWWSEHYLSLIHLAAQDNSA